MKKRYVVVFFLLFLFLPTSVFANRLYSIDGDAKIGPEGDLEIHQRWTMQIDQGTEIYIPMTHLNHMTLDQFHVKDETGKEYEYLSHWNVHSTREQKAFKCGINQGNGGPELCFGVSGTGRKVYDIYYTFKNAVSGYPDMDGYNIRFINDQMNPLPEQVKMTFEMPGKQLSKENTKIWGFGYQGQIVFDNGKVVAQSNGKFNSVSHMTVMMGFQKGMLHPRTQGNGTFEDLKNIAFQGSNYKDQGSGTTVQTEKSTKSSQNKEKFWTSFRIMRILSCIVLFFIFSIGGLLIKKRNSLGGRIPENYTDVDIPKDFYYREIPCEGYLVPTYFLMELKDSLNGQLLLSAYLLKWIYEGNLEIYEEEQLKGFFIFKRMRSSIALHLLHRPQLQLGFESSLWDFLVEATGKDAILEEGEFEKYMKENYSKFSKIIKQVGTSWEDYAFKKNLIVEKPGRFGKKVFLTSEGKDVFQNTVGFFQYLNDYTLLRERGITEVTLWDQYLIFATLFGIGQEVLEEMKKIAPNYDLIRENSIQGTNYDTFRVYNMVNSISSSAYRSYSSSSGGGGSVSFGGGGGFSGGGSGGGVR